LGVVLVFLLSSCTTNTPSTFDPGGPAAATISSLWWLLFGLAAFVYIVVMGVMVYAIFHSRQDVERNARFHTYWGLCAELCGVQHAKMLFMVAKPPTELADWLSQQAQPATVPSEAMAERGFQVFMEANCDECHVIQGTEADGELGPDLTHFADRLTLGAGAARNSRGNLAGWIVNPHGLKPGNLMPAAADISGEDLQALLAYLETLQ
jgi:cytochrome c1